jgi:hypothetical protein
LRSVPLHVRAGGAFSDCGPQSGDYSQNRTLALPVLATDYGLQTHDCDAGTPVGRDFNRLFLGFLQREFGPESFRVERVTAPRADQPAARPSEEVCA